MTMKEAMYRRHMVRKYQDKSIPDDLNEKLSSRINENNERYGLGIIFRNHKKEQIWTFLVNGF